MKKWICALAMMMSSSALAQTAEQAKKAAFAAPEGTMLYVVIAALIIALIVLVVLRGQLKTASHQSGAAEYAREDSFELVIRRDRFTHQTVQRTKIEQKK